VIKLDGVKPKSPFTTKKAAMPPPSKRWLTAARNKSVVHSDGRSCTYSKPSTLHTAADVAVVVATVVG
jgi:hypothetical protein